MNVSSTRGTIPEKLQGDDPHMDEGEEEEQRRHHEMGWFPDRKCALECGKVAVQIPSKHAADCRHQEQPGGEGRIPVGPEVRGPKLEGETGVDQDCEESHEAYDD